MLLLWILFVALTGAALNHTHHLSLDKVPLPASVLNSIYGVAPPQIISYPLGGHWVSLVGGEKIYLGIRETGYCTSLSGVGALGEELFAACEDSLYLFTRDGELIERMSASFGLPTPIARFGPCGDTLCLVSEQQHYRLDSGDYSWQPASDGAITLAAPGLLDPELRDTLIRANTPENFHLERLVKDLHSGVIFGLGPWLMDIFAIGIAALAFTGLTMWWRTRRPL